MRVFAALELPSEVRSLIAEWQRPLALRYPSVKWVSPENMHLTLRFFGDIDRDRVDRILERMSGWEPGDLEFSLTQVGSFIKNGLPVVYWLGGDFPSDVGEMARSLGDIMDERGRKESRPFKPHLTIARRRKHSEVPELDDPCVITGCFRRASLIDSRLTRRGPEYTFLKRFDLHAGER